MLRSTILYNRKVYLCLLVQLLFFFYIYFSGVFLTNQPRVATETHTEWSRYPKLLPGLEPGNSGLQGRGASQQATK